MKWKRWSLALVSLALVAAACGGGEEAPPGEGGTEPCSPSGTTIGVVAQNNSFDKDCLAAPADTAFTVEFANQDGGTPHNFAIYQDETAAEDLFKGEVFNGASSTTYEVPALPAGTYFFRCDVHPGQMNGTFVVGG